IASRLGTVKPRMAIEAHHVRAAWDHAARIDEADFEIAEEEETTPHRVVVSSPADTLRTEGEPEFEDPPEPERNEPPFSFGQISSALGSALRASPTPSIRHEPRPPVAGDTVVDFDSESSYAQTGAGLGAFRLAGDFRLATFAAWDEDDANIAR